MKTLAVFLAASFVPSVYAQIPINNECINATVIPSNRGVTSNYTTAPVEFKGATANVLDPITACSAFTYDDPRGTDGSSLWYSWQPSSSGEFDFSTDGSTYADEEDTTNDDFFNSGVRAVIGVYKGDECDSIEEISCAYLFGNIRGLNLVGGEKYYIKVGVFQAFRGGTLKLTVKPAPPTPANTKCIDAITIDPIVGGTVTGDISSAEIDEASAPCAEITFGFFKGVWYKVENPSASTLLVVASTCNAKTEFDSLISVFVGDDCESLSCISVIDDAQIGDCGLQSVISFRALGLSTYYVLVQGYEDGTGEFTLTVNSTSNFFGLIDSESSVFIEPLGDTFYYGTLANSKLNIQAIFSDETPTESVLVTFDNPVRSFCEEFPPFSVFWDTDGDYFDALIPVGEHTVTATPFAQPGCVGTMGTPLSKNFEAIGCFIEYSIYDVDANCPYNYLYQDSFFDNLLDSIPCNTNVYVFPYCGFVADTVKIELRNTGTNVVVASTTESTFPFFLFGNDEEVANSGSISPGSYEITTTINGLVHLPISFTIQNACFSF